MGLLPVEEVGPRPSRLEVQISCCAPKPAAMFAKRVDQANLVIRKDPCKASTRRDFGSNRFGLVEDL
jgi:hypothetical protein